MEKYATLPKSFKKYGYLYEEVERVNNVCIFSQSDEESGRLYAYEVFELVRLEETKMPSGNVIPAKEAPPSSGKWGQNAFTVHALEQAKAKIALILENIANREAEILKK